MMDGIYENDSRSYVDPNKGIEETNAFIDNLRNIQQQNNDQITADTKALGSDLPVGQGGLVGAGGIWRNRFQNPQVANMISGLRASAQATALSQQLQNEMAQAQQRYKNAYRDAYKRAKAAANNNNNNNTPDTPQGNVDTKVYTPANDAILRSMWQEKYNEAMEQAKKDATHPNTTDSPVAQALNYDPISGAKLW